MPRLLPLAALLAAGALLAGCGGRDGATPAPTPAPTPARTTGSPTGAPTSYAHYVALGDSYTAAPLVPPTDTTSICLRSGVDYPALVARAMPGSALTDVSCSGATTQDMTSSQSGLGGTVPPQFDALKSDTDLVTIGIGGNDDALFATTIGKCTKLATSDPTGAPCAAAIGSQLPQALSDIRANLAGVVDGVRERSPQARIVVVGYPQIVPATGSCPDLLPLAAGDYAFVRSVDEGLARSVRLGAADAHAEYVDLWAPSADHDICASDPWINGQVTTVGKALAFHPFAVEQQAVAQLVLTKLGLPVS